MASKKRVLITGILGQDGSYLAEFLVTQNYDVFGIARRTSFENPDHRYSRIKHILQDKKVHLCYGDICDYTTICRIIQQVLPDEIYHLAAQSHVGISFKDDFGKFKNNLKATHILLSIIREMKPDCKFYFAATSEMFGNASICPQDETVQFCPVSPYSISKTAAFYTTKMFREAYGLFACSGILFNHESPRRGFEFVTRKITSTAVKIKLGIEKELRLGNLEAKRDWGFAGEYVEAMWRMLQYGKPDDYVVGTGENHSVQEFVEIVFDYLNIDWRTYVIMDDDFFRPADVNVLLANPEKIKKILGWSPQVKFYDLIKMMIDSDMEYFTKVH